MKIFRLIIAAGLALGLSGAASASPLGQGPLKVIGGADAAVEYAKNKGHKGWKGHRGRHYGWDRGRHRGWYKPHRRVYYAPPRRHYGWYRGRHYGWHKPRPVVHFRF